MTRFTARRGKPKYITKNGKTYVEREGRLIEIEFLADAADTKAEAPRLAPLGALKTPPQSGVLCASRVVREPVGATERS